MTAYSKSKSDQIMAVEVKEALEAYVAAANEALERGLVVSFSISNGSDGKPVSINQLQVIKRILLPGEGVPANDVG